MKVLKVNRQNNMIVCEGKGTGIREEGKEKMKKKNEGKKDSRMFGFSEEMQFDG